MNCFAENVKHIIENASRCDHFYRTLEVSKYINFAHFKISREYFILRKNVSWEQSFSVLLRPRSSDYWNPRLSGLRPTDSYTINSPMFHRTPGAVARPRLLLHVARRVQHLPLPRDQGGRDPRGARLGSRQEVPASCSRREQPESPTPACGRHSALQCLKEQRYRLVDLNQRNWGFGATLEDRRRGESGGKSLEKLLYFWYLDVTLYYVCSYCLDETERTVYF